jgi:hypothetical protein
MTIASKSLVTAQAGGSEVPPERQSAVPSPYTPACAVSCAVAAILSIL